MKIETQIHTQTFHQGNFSVTIDQKKMDQWWIRKYELQSSLTKF